jgi:hypothetical protein
MARIVAPFCHQGKYVLEADGVRRQSMTAVVA